MYGKSIIPHITINCQELYKKEGNLSKFCSKFFGRSKPLPYKQYSESYTDSLFFICLLHKTPLHIVGTGVLDGPQNINPDKTPSHKRAQPKAIMPRQTKSAATPTAVHKSLPQLLRTEQLRE